MTKVWFIFAFVHLCLLSPTVCEAAQGMFDFSVKVCSYISLCVPVCLSVRLLTRLCDIVHAIHVKRQVIAKKYSLLLSCSIENAARILYRDLRIFILVMRTGLRTEPSFVSLGIKSNTCP